MAQNVQAHIEGSVSGQLAVGNNYAVQIGSIRGSTVTIAPPEQQPHVRPRPVSDLPRPRPFPDLLDRAVELSTAKDALQSAQPVEFFAQPGAGKTALLRSLAYPAAAISLPDGIVYLSVLNQPLVDVLQFLWGAFYESDAPFKPTDAQIRLNLQTKKALILLDDVELTRDEVTALLNVAPGCAFFLATSERRLWGEGKALGLGGLPPNDALTLIERELGRVLTSEEGPAAQSLCIALDGHPLHLLEVAAMAREERCSMVEVARRVGAALNVAPTARAQALAFQVMTALSESEQRVLAVLAVLKGAPTHAEHLAALAGLGDATPVLEGLQRRGLVQAHGPRYSLTGALDQSLQQMGDLTPWAERALAYFTTWAEGQQRAPNRLLEEADAILRLLEWAVKMGRWRDVVRLGRAIEGALALGGRWGAWVQVLRWMLQAAQALQDPAIEAWTLHQFGTQALCQGSVKEARASLSQALRIREAIGDRAGAAVTRHNLDLLLPPPAPPQRPPQPPSPPAPSPGVPFLVKGLITALAVSLLGIGGLATWLWSHPMPTPPTPQPPSLSLPGDMTVEATSPSGATVSFDTSATDPVDGNLPVTCRPSSGSVFALGQTTVTCSASNRYGMTDSGSFQVKVQHTAPPEVVVPGSILVEAADRSGAKVTYTVSASDAVDGAVPVKCDHPSGSTFALGDTTVTCTATDSGGNTGTGSFQVKVQHTLPPKVNVPKDMTLEAASSAGAKATFTVSASDAVDGAVPVKCNPVSGWTFAMGGTPVTCTATDSGGNTGTGSFQVKVQHTAGPKVNVPKDMTVEATGPSGAEVTYPPPSASDAVDGPVPVTCDRLSPSTFGFGTITVNCTASDSAHNTGRGAFRVTVQDKTPPQVTVPPPPKPAEAMGPAGAAVFYPPPSASDVVDGAVPVTCDHPSGSTFHLGTTTVTCTARDAHANTGTGTFKVIVQDTKPPTIQSVVPSSDVVYATGESGCQPSTVAITAKVTDIYGVGRVVVYHRYVSYDGIHTSGLFENETSLGNDGYTRVIDVRSEFAQSWPLIGIGSSSGRMEYYVVAWDKARNQTQSVFGSVQVHNCGPS